MNTKILLKKLAKRFPKRIAKDNHDRVGLMAGKLPEEVHKILLCLDFDDEVMAKAKEFQPDLILTHHPFIFGTRAFVLAHDQIKKNLYDRILANNMCVYSMHTNFDTGKGGMNDALANRLGLINIYAPMKDPMMRIGYLKEAMPIEEFAKKVKHDFNVNYGLLVKGNEKLIHKVGIIGGGGSRRVFIANDEGCDIFISGDAPHYVRRDCINYGINYLDMPHEIEKIFMPTMKEILLGYDETLDILIVDHEKEPIIIQ